MTTSRTVIRARIHDNALRRLTRAYSATVADIFAETLQNARRAAATRVHVSLVESPDGGTITITDDGEGISDPSVLLSIGENGWDESLVRREDAAGMGMLSLARRGCTVVSRPRPAEDGVCDGWRVTLTPEHFLGEADAELESPVDTPFQHGTQVGFETKRSEIPYHIRCALETAARFYPLPVFFSGNSTSEASRTPPEGEPLPRRGFLDGAVLLERWRGLVFGVFRNTRPVGGFTDPDVNFHGLTVPARLPSPQTVFGSNWTVAADVESCPELEFVLPARKEVVETPFLESLRGAALKTAWRAMAAETNPRPSHRDWKQAREQGIEITPPPAELVPWRPPIADVDDWRESPAPAPVGEDALIVDCDPEPPHAQAFWRAAKRDGLATRLFEPESRLEGFAWYDAIPRISRIQTMVSTNGESWVLEEWQKATSPKSTPPDRPESIRMQVTVNPHGRSQDTDPAPAGSQGESGQPGPQDGNVPGERTLDLPADLAFAGEAWSHLDEAQPLVCKNSTIDPRELADLLCDAFYSPSDAAEADSWQRQRTVFEQDSLHLAMRMLVSDDEARRLTIADVVSRELRWLLPRDRDIHIAFRDGRVTVNFAEQPPGKA